MTKAKTRAGRRRAKGGRPPLPANDREPNGRASRRINAEEGRIMDVAVSTRIRHLGLVDNKVETAEKQAIDPRRGYVLGLILLDGKITQEQHDIGIRYAEDMTRYYGMKNPHGLPSPRAQNLFAIHGTGLDEAEDRQKAGIKIGQRRHEIEAALLACGDIATARKIEHTIKQVCIMDTPESRLWPDPMMWMLRRGLNALGKMVYGTA